MDRPGLESAMAAVEHGEADGIAVAKLDRFARSVPGAAKALARLEAAGGVLVAVDLGMDTSTPAGKLMRNVLLALAEFEVDRIRENWKDASSRAVARGVHVSRVPPYGYRRKEDGRFEPDPVQAPLVAEMFAQRARGVAWKDLAAFMDISDPRPKGAWPWQTITTIIKRRTYLGEAFTGDAVNPDAHEPLVDRDLWERAQSQHPRAPTRHERALLAGIIRCAACGYTMSQATDGARGYINYNCRKRHSGGVCPKPARISQRRANEYVAERFLIFAADTSVSDHELTIDTERATAAVEAAERELAAYRDGELVSVLGERSFRDGLEQRARRVDDARAGLARLRRNSDTTLLGDINTPGIWDALTVAQQRQLLAATIDAVFVRQADHSGRAPFEHRLHICWAGQAPPNLPGRQVSALRPFAFPDD